MSKHYKKNNNIILELIKYLIYILILPILLIIYIAKLINNKNTKNIKTNNNTKYHIKDKTISDCEMYFYNIIKKHFGDKYDIRVQVPLSSVIEKEKDFERQYQNELYRSIDIGIFDLKTTAPLLLIEINDRTHHNKDRKARDGKVKEICNQAGLPLLTFWTEYSNTENYIIKRIRENLER